MRGQMDHSLHVVVKEVLAAADLSLDDIVSWGGQVRYDPGLPNNPNRLGAAQRGEVDMIIDEAVRSWVNNAAGSGIRILPLDEAMLTRLEGLGFRRAVISQAELSQTTGRRAVAGFQRVHRLYARECCGYYRDVNLCRSGGEERRDRMARTRASASRPHVPRYRGWTARYSAACRRRTVLARARLSFLIARVNWLILKQARRRMLWKTTPISLCCSPSRVEAVA